MTVRRSSSRCGHCMGKQAIQVGSDVLLQHKLGVMLSQKSRLSLFSFPTVRKEVEEVQLSFSPSGKERRRKCAKFHLGRTLTSNFPSVSVVGKEVCCTDVANTYLLQVAKYEMFHNMRKLVNLILLPQRSQQQISSESELTTLSLCHNICLTIPFQ